MIEDGLWQVVKSGMEWLILPLLGGISYFFRKYIHRVELLEKKINKVELKVAVVETNIDHMREDLVDIKTNIQKILDRL